ncbi:actin-related protein C2B [Prunus dulcis]|uniref:Arp2/3 complex 34 kDa subunit n=1 Tax=Prunus dulcis TaxID=3755 RepID=A0A4Y1QL70_PRUDU|nr:actin-related protein C2B [Prunus dulcis]
MACLERASPALKRILLKLYRENKSIEIDHHLYEFGSVEYHIQSSTSDTHYTNLSVSTPLLSQGVILPNGISHYTKQMVIADISAVQAVILSSQLKEMLMNVSSQDTFQGMYKTIKLVYHPRQPFFIVRQPQKILAVFPIRFKDKTDVIIATAFFQELVDVGSSEKWAKAPPCCWSPIPPPELRGELLKI